VVVTLSGKADNSSTLPAGDLKYNWSQISGPTVTLSGGSSPTASFTAPSLAALTKCTFTLTVSSASEGTNNTNSADVSNDPKAIDTGNRQLHDNNAERRYHCHHRAHQCRRRYRQALCAASQPNRRHNSRYGERRRRQVHLRCYGREETVKRRQCFEQFRRKGYIYYYNCEAQTLVDDLRMSLMCM
jgi:hypothetical protein